MLAAAVASSGLGKYLDHVISVDAVRTYKPSPLVYALAPGTLGIPAGEILFVSSNAWDVAGAKTFGYQAAWCNRTDAPEEDVRAAGRRGAGAPPAEVRLWIEELGVRPDVVVRALDQLPR
jgi:2-haloacid dehalogenase